jgi:hypothetical protein
MTEYAGGKKGFIVKYRPDRYPMTDQQKKLRDTVKECGIVKGIKKKELQQRMVDCVGPKMRGEEKKEEEKPSFLLSNP